MYVATHQQLRNTYALSTDCMHGTLLLAAAAIAAVAGMRCWNHHVHMIADID